MIAGFVALAGLTGAIISRNEQLERVFAPSLFVLAPEVARKEPLDVFALRDAAERQTGFAVNGVDWTRRPDAPAFFNVEARPGGPAPHDDEIALDPSSGRIVGARRHGDLRQGLINLMPFIYDVHESLALGAAGTLVLGIVALLWTIDCFVGAYLTFPARAVPRRSGGAFLKRWAPAWMVRRASGFKLLYDLHRAGGLWPASFNLSQVYEPVTNALLGTENSKVSVAPSDRAGHAVLGWREAHSRGQVLMAQVGARLGFRVISERLMFYDPGTRTYAYRVLSSKDFGALGNTQIRFAGDDGRLLAVSVPTGGAPGTTFTTWIADIHTGEVLGLFLRIVLSLTGVAVASLSTTGVWLWWRKRKSRQSANHRPSAQRRT